MKKLGQPHEKIWEDSVDTSRELNVGVRLFSTSFDSVDFLLHDFFLNRKQVQPKIISLFTSTSSKHVEVLTNWRLQLKGNRYHNGVDITG